MGRKEEGVPRGRPWDSDDLGQPTGSCEQVQHTQGGRQGGGGEGTCPFRRSSANGNEFGWILGVGDGQGGLVCCGSWGHKESDMTEQLN